MNTQADGQKLTSLRLVKHSRRHSWQETEISFSPHLLVAANPFGERRAQRKAASVEKRRRSSCRQVNLGKDALPGKFFWKKSILSQMHHERACEKFRIAYMKTLKDRIIWNWRIKW